MITHSKTATYMYIEIIFKHYVCGRETRYLASTYNMEKGLKFKELS